MVLIFKCILYGLIVGNSQASLQREGLFDSDQSFSPLLALCLRKSMISEGLVGRQENELLGDRHVVSNSRIVLSHIQVLVQQTSMLTVQYESL